MGNFKKKKVKFFFPEANCLRLIGQVLPAVEVEGPDDAGPGGPEEELSASGGGARGRVAAEVGHLCWNG